MKHTHQHAFFLFVFATLFTLLGFVASVDANPTYTVRTVYFQPTGAPDPQIEIINLLKKCQDFYRDEMNRHGYGPKTFMLETDGAGNIGFYHVRGTHNTHHYLTDTYNSVKSELPFQFTRDSKAQDNVLVIIVGGINRLSTGDRGFGGYFTGNKVGGAAIIAGEALIFELLAHEIGHTFGLAHTTDPTAIMNAGSDILLDYEARWLDRHHFFNDIHIRNGSPQFVKNLPIQAVGDNTLRFKIVAESENGLYHLLMARKRDGFIVGTAETEGHGTTIKVDVRRQDLIDGDNVDIQIMDIHGNKAYKTISNITLPEPVIVDINFDGIVNVQDLVLVAARLGDVWEGQEDVNNDGIVNILDLVLVANAF